MCSLRARASEPRAASSAISLKNHSKMVKIQSISYQDAFIFTNFYENLRRFMLFLPVFFLPILPNRYNPTCSDDAYHASALARRASTPSFLLQKQGFSPKIPQIFPKKPVFFKNSQLLKDQILSFSTVTTGNASFHWIILCFFPIHLTESRASFHPIPRTVIIV